ncbi:hypothetical protein GCM10010975_24710 [Comamonas phosphati]|nr:hypothetical protein GCM10010975_24710 [Comamonas phosphati]
MTFETAHDATVIGRRMRLRREALEWSQEKVGVEIGIDESASRARISRYELGIHEPPVKTARLIAQVLGVSLTYLYCEDDELAALLLAMESLSKERKSTLVAQWLAELDAGVLGIEKASL